MFNDVRSKKIVLVSHCIINQNAISDGTAGYSGTNESILKLLMEAQVGIIQLPCPELSCLGLDRGDRTGATRPVVVENSRIRQELMKPNSQQVINRLVEQVVYQIEEYIKNGFTILGIIGINRSPSCGINTTSENNEEVNGRGVFMEALGKALARRNIGLDMIGIKDAEIEDSLAKVKQLLNK